MQLDVCLEIVKETENPEIILKDFIQEKYMALKAGDVKKRRVAL